jgi:hypothetical protein
MVEIETGSVVSMQDASSTELLQELDEKRRRISVWPIVVVVSLTAACALFVARVHPVIQILIDTCWGAAVYLAFQSDTFRKTVVLFYSFDTALERSYETLHKAALQLAGSAGCWHIAASGQVHDRKYHAGASAVVDRKATTIRRGSPPFLKTNVETIAIGVGKQTMFLFPDRVLVYESGKVGAIGYDQLRISITQTQFVENSAPRDARVVGQTWRYVNKTGGPDRRFADNRSLPICLYDEVHFSSTSGLNEIIQLSQCGIGDSLEKAIAALNAQLLQGKRVRV